MSATAASVALSIARCVSAEMFQSSASGSVPVAVEYRGELADVAKSLAAMRSSTRSHIVAVGVPSMTECSPTKPALPSGRTTNWHGLSIHLLRRPRRGWPLGCGTTAPCQRLRECSTRPFAGSVSRQRTKAAE